MRIEQWNYLIELAQYHSLSEASEHLHISQQSLNASIKKLEEEIGVALLQRSYRGIKLTEAGQKYVEGVNKLMAEHNELLLEISNPFHQPRNELQIGAYYGCMKTYFATVIAKFCSKDPRTKLTVEEMTPDQVLKKLEAREIDLGLMQYSNFETPAWMEDPKFLFFPLFHSKLYVRVSTKSPLAQYDSISLKTALKEKVLVYQPSAWENDINPLCDFLAYFHPDCHVQFEHNYQLHHEKLLQGLGIAFALQTGTSSNSEQGGIKMLSLKDDIENTNGCLLRNEEISPTTKYVINFFRILLAGKNPD